MNGNNEVALIISVASFSVSVIFILTSIILYLVNRYNQRVCSIHTTAEVVDIKFRRSLYGHGVDRMKGWSPVYKYYVNGEEMTHISNIYYANKNKYHVGQKVDIYVNPNNKDKFYSDSKTMIIIKNIFAIVGILLLILSIYLYCFM